MLSAFRKREVADAMMRMFSFTGVAPPTRVKELVSSAATSSPCALSGRSSMLLMNSTPPAACSNTPACTPAASSAPCMATAAPSSLTPVATSCTKGPVARGLSECM